MELEEYVKLHLTKALNSIIQSERANELPNLSIYEKAIIFAYTDTQNIQHQALNERLWASKGTEITDFGVFFEATLNKLDSYNGMVFRGVQSAYFDVERYIKAYESKTILTEYTFLSASKFQIIAQGFGSILFKIYGENAKSVELISKFGREKEVIFQRNTSFKVVKIANNGFFPIITLKEI
jgi:hypothetical protein